MRDDPLIFTDCAMKRPKAKPARTTGSTDWYNTPTPEATKQKEELLIRDSLTEWDCQCSRHARHEHIQQVPFFEDTKEVSVGGGADEIKNVPGGMPPETQTLLYLSCLC